MYRIGICDDEVSTCIQLEEFIKKYLKEKYIEHEIEVFYSGEALCKYLKFGNKFELLFLDIEFETVDGIQVGKYIREILEDEITDIIFISSKSHYAMQLFACRPLDFMIKPIKYLDLERIMDIVVKRNHIYGQYLEFQYQKVYQKIPLREIVYLRSDNKKIHVILCSGEEKIFNGKLAWIEEKLPETTFLKIHKSYLVNYNYVKEYTYEWVKMVNGDVLSISKAQRKLVRSKLLFYEMQ